MVGFYLQVSREVGAGDDSSNRGEEYSEHGEEVVLNSLKVSIV